MSEYIRMNDAPIYNYQKDIIVEKDKEIERLNDIINKIRKDLEVIEQSNNIDTIKMNLRTIIYKLERVEKE